MMTLCEDLLATVTISHCIIANLLFNIIGEIRVFHGFLLNSWFNCRIINISLCPSLMMKQSLEATQRPFCAGD